MIRFYRATTYEAMSLRAASFMSAQVLSNPNSVIGLATGSTPIGMYEELARRCAQGKITFRDVHSVNLDEYYGIAPDHDQSYRYFMNLHFFDHIDILKENTHVPNGMNPDPHAECARYDALIDSLGGIDMQLLGIGRDGHIGFNEPGDAFIPGTNYVKLTDDTIDANSRFFASADEVPKYALTTGIRAIMQAKKILMVVNGENKAKVLEEAFFGPVTPQNPASILQLHPDVVVCGDLPAMAVIAEKHPGVVID